MYICLLCGFTVWFSGPLSERLDGEARPGWDKRFGRIAQLA